MISSSHRIPVSSPDLGNRKAGIGQTDKNVASSGSKSVHVGEFKTVDQLGTLTPIKPKYLTDKDFQSFLETFNQENGTSGNELIGAAIIKYDKINLDQQLQDKINDGYFTIIVPIKDINHEGRKIATLMTGGALTMYDSTLGNSEFQSMIEKLDKENPSLKNNSPQRQYMVENMIKNYLSDN